MSTDTCPQLEQLFEGLITGDATVKTHLESCDSCAAIVEEHRQLEKDLLRLADPLPPPDFVHLVMAKVEKAPVPLRRELWTGAAIFLAALIGVATIVVSDAATAGALGTSVAGALLGAREFADAAGHGLRTIWSTAALPVTAFASLLFMFLLLGLRRVVAPNEARIRVSR